jgi:hypothetical protein
MNQKPRHLGVTKAITNFKNASGDVKFFKLQFHQNLAWMLYFYHLIRHKYDAVAQNTPILSLPSGSPYQKYLPYRQP